MRVTKPLVLLALTAGLFTPTAAAQGGMTDRMREEIRRIVREEVRAALRDLRADARSEAREERGAARAERRSDRSSASDGRRVVVRTKAKDEAGDVKVGFDDFGVIVRGKEGEKARWVTRPEGLEAVEVELEKIDDLLRDLGVKIEAQIEESIEVPEIELQLEHDLKDIEAKLESLKLEALPKMEFHFDSDSKEWKALKGLEGLKALEGLKGMKEIKVGPKSRIVIGDGFEVLSPGKDDDGVKVFEWRTGDGETKVEGKGKVRIWADGKELLDESYDIEGAGPFRVFVEDGKVRIDEGGDVKIYRLKGDGDRKVEVKVEKAGGDGERKTERRLVRRRTMV